jgi:RHS repeat-associated protein
VVLVADRYFIDPGGVDGTPVHIHGLSTNVILNDLGVDRPLASVGYSGYDTGCGGSPVMGRTYFYHADERGSLRNVTYESSSVCASAGYSYQGFGQNGGAIPSNSKPGYTGAQSDASGLVFMRNRFYDPNTGTFTQADPIGLLGGINLYGYVGNNPIAYTDPFGLTKCDDLRKKIEDATEVIKDKWRDYQRYHRQGKADAGHYEDLTQRQNGLRRDISDYNKNCGGDDDPGGSGFAPALQTAAKWTQAPVPSPQRPMRAKPGRDCFMASASSAGEDCFDPVRGIVIPGGLAPRFVPSLPVLPTLAPIRVPVFAFP